eukprot:711358-Hanusia_phi.AAC.3
MVDRTWEPKWKETNLRKLQLNLNCTSHLRACWTAAGEGAGAADERSQKPREEEEEEEVVLRAAAASLREMLTCPRNSSETAAYMLLPYLSPPRLPPRLNHVPYPPPSFLLPLPSSPPPPTSISQDRVGRAQVNACSKVGGRLLEAVEAEHVDPGSKQVLRLVPLLAALQPLPPPAGAMATQKPSTSRAATPSEMAGKRGRRGRWSENFEPVEELEDCVLPRVIPPDML